MATTHYNRVIADGGVLPSGISGLASVLDSVIAAYSITDSTDFNTKVPVFLDPHYTGYKLGAGSGTTLGQAARTVYAISSTADVTQTTAASQPLLLAHSGVNYWWGSGVSGNYCSTPDAAVNQIIGDIELKACINIGTIVGSEGLTPVICKTNSYYMILYSNYEIKFYNGTTVSAATTTIPTNTTFTKITRSALSGDINFYTSTQSINTDINLVTWTKLGNTVSSTAGNLPISLGALFVGGAGNAWPCLGKIYRATISNSIGGAPVVDFNPATYNAAVSQTSWTSSTSEIWTINTGTAGTGYKGVLVDRTITMFDAINDSLTSTINRPNVLSQYLAYKTENAYAGGYAFITSTSGTYNNAITPQGNDMVLYMNSAVNGLFKTLGTLLTLWTTTNNQGVSNTIQKNNDTEVSDAYTPAISGSGLSIGKTGSASVFQKGNLNTYLCANSADTTTTRTVIYNIIRSMNNNAF
jgi:hypothetical protein